MVTFASPVQGIIHPNTWRRPTGNTDFRVTLPFGVVDAQHPAPGHSGIDIGDAAVDADAVRAARAGKVTLTRELDGTVHIDHGDGWLTVYAHLRLLPGNAFEVKVGDVLAAGDLVGHIGATSPMPIGAHLHFETKQKVGAAWVHRDPWPMLTQNQEDEVTTITITAFGAKRRWKTGAAGQYVGFKVGAASKPMQLGLGTWANADASVEIAPTPAGWPAGPYLRVVDGGFKGYFIEAARVTLDAAADEPCAEAIAAAVERYEKRIAAIKAKVAAFGIDIADD